VRDLFQILVLNDYVISHIFFNIMFSKLISVVVKNK